MFFNDDEKAIEKASGVAVAEFFLKMVLYYLHERIWYKSNFGLNERRRREIELLNLAKKAIILAGEEIMKVYAEDFDVQQKADDTPLTTADRNANKIIEDILKESNIPILSEEGKHNPYEERKKWDLLWIVDPLDGTKEFIKEMENLP